MMDVPLALEMEVDRWSSPTSPHKGVLPCLPKEGGLYPNVDLSVLLRSCIKEIESPIEGTVTGEIPSWLSGSLLMNGPGKFSYGPQTVGHLFDGSALLQKYAVDKGKAYYMCRYLRSAHFLKNLSAHRVVTNEFGTAASAAPTTDTNGGDDGQVKERGLAGRIAAMAGGMDEMMSDNTYITVYPLGSDYYCYYESPFVHRIDPETLITMSRVNLNRKLWLTSIASHPHWDTSGNMFIMGTRIGVFGPEYVVNKIAPTKDSALDSGDCAPSPVEVEKDFCQTIDDRDSPFEAAQTVTKVRARWPISPCYMHSFAMTDHYIVLIEHPLTIHLPTMLLGRLCGQPDIDSLKWRGDESTIIHIIDRNTGDKIGINFKSEAFFFMHTINAYEERGHIVMDIACYDNPDMMKGLDIKALQDAQSNPNYAQLFCGRPKRFVLPLWPSKHAEEVDLCSNLVSLPVEVGKGAAAWWDKGSIAVRPRLICNIGCEMPTINYTRFNGRKYRYFYGISGNVDDPESSGKLFKVDVQTGEVKQWWQKDVYCAEPTFMQRPGSEDEDDGVLVAAVIRGSPDVRYTALLVLDARDLTEVARAEFNCAGPVPKPLHGYFTGNNQFE